MKFKRWIAGLVLTLGVAISAHALLPLGAAVVWLGGVVTANASFVGALEASIYVHTAAFVAYDMFFAPKDSTGKPTGSAPLTVKLNPDAARSNPDPDKFNNPAGGSRDVTPKATTTGTRTSINTPAGLAPPTKLFCYQTTCAATQSSACAGRPAPGNRDVNGHVYAGHYEFTGGDCNIVYVPLDNCCGPLTIGPTGFTVITNNATVCPGTGASASGLPATGGKCPASNFPETGPVNCADGYASSGSGTDCALRDAGKVKKPDTQPCEILRSSAGFQTDAANPNCTRDGVQIQGNSVQVDGQSISINADGSVSVATPTGQTTFQITANNGDGSVTIGGVSRSGNPGAYVPGSGGSPGGGGGTGGTGTAPSCGGVGQPACSNGNGNGNCGAPGQPACSIDDYGFAGKTVSTAQGEAAIDDYNTQRSGLLDGIKNGVAAPNFGWQMPVQSLACRPLEFGFFKGMHFRINWCQYIDLIHQAISFLAYCFTALYLFGLFYGGERQGSK